MIYKFVSVERDYNGRAIYYILKNVASGKVHRATRQGVLNLINSGNMLAGLKLGSDNRILVDKKTTATIKVKRNTGSEYTPEVVLGGAVDVYTGEALIQFVHGGDRYENRDHVEKIVHNVKLGIMPRVIIIQGIRRTGKTTAMQHTIAKLLKDDSSIINKIVYMNITNETLDATTFRAYLNKYNSMIIFIDEITRVRNFVNEASGISDNIAARNVVILSGTDSYAFTQAMRDSLYGRHITFNFTRLTYTEYLRLFDKSLAGLSGNEKAEEFKLYGGVLSRSEYDTAIQTYVSIQNALVKNVVDTVKRNSGYRSTPDYVAYLVKQSEERVVLAIIRIVMGVCNIDREWYSGMMDNVNIGKEAYRFVLNITSEGSDIETGSITNNKYSLRKELLINTAKVLYELGVINTVHNASKTDTEYYNLTKFGGSHICLLPSILFTITVEMISKLSAEKEYKDFDLDSIRQGVTAENLVLSQCALHGYQVDFLRYELTNEGLKHFGETNKIPEIDCVVTYKTGVTKTQKTLIEVKHSSKPKTEHAKNLRLKSVADIIWQDNTRRLVVYTGATTEVHGITYVNIHDFLTNIKYWVEG